MLGSTAFVTVTLTLIVSLPLFTVMVHVPSFFAVIFAFFLLIGDTFAICASEDFHVEFLFVVTVLDLPSSNVILFWDTVIFGVTVTLIFFVLFLLFTVMVHLPSFTAVIFTFFLLIEDIFAIFALEDFQVTFMFAVIFLDFPATSVTFSCDTTS